MPDLRPRKNQIRALEWLEETQPRYALLQAPVGAGKSLIGATYANFLLDKARQRCEENRTLRNASYVFTPQRILQKQYQETFDPEFMGTLYGKSNYQCTKLNGMLTCDIGSALKPRCGNCPHRNAKAAAGRATNLVFNYKLALTSFQYTENWNHRPLIVLDECHTAEEFLTEMDAVSITKSRCEKYEVKWRKFKEIQSAADWLEDVYLPKANDYKEQLYSELRDIIELGNDPSTNQIKKLREYYGLVEHIESTSAVTTSQDVGSDFVLVTDDSMLKFKRIHAGHSFRRILDPMADHFLFMSSTILNHKGFCRDLGLDMEHAAYLDLPSEFSPDNRPVFYIPQCKMNASWQSDENTNGRKKMIATIKDILDIHKGENGIIHTGNFAVAKWLVDQLDGNVDHDVFHHNPSSDGKIDRNDIIDAFIASDRPSVLISPSITEGLDLKEDLGRFAIFTKIPFGFLGDQWIKRRMEMSQEWYQRRALTEVIQGCGRVVRSPTDQGNVYILDQSWGYLMKRAGNQIPEWWFDGYLEQG